MKNFTVFLTVAFGLWTLDLAAQITNGVKVSSLPAATTPLTGNELLPLVQTGATKSATVAQLLAGPVAAATTASNLFAAGLATAAANNLTTSNALLTLHNSASNALATAAATASNALATATAATSNALTAAVAAANSKDTATSNALQTALGSYYPASNPAGYQTATQTTAAVTAGIAGITTLTLTNYNYALPPAVNFTNSGQTLCCNLAAGSLQRAYIYQASGSTLTLSCTNATAGQSVTWFIQNQTGVTYTILTDNLMVNYNGTGNGTGIVLAGGKNMAVSFLAFGPGSTNVVFSAAAQK